MNTPLKNSNGNDLPEHRQKQVEAGLAQYQALAAECDELRRRLKEAETKIEGYVVQVNSLLSVSNMMESTMTTYRIQRDEAVIASAGLREAFETICMIAAKHAQAPEPDKPA